MRCIKEDGKEGRLVSNNKELQRSTWSVTTQKTQFCTFFFYKGLITVT